VTRGAERPVLLLDTSVAIALLFADHAAHVRAIRAVRGFRLGLAGHAWFETFSVLTRMPAGRRRSPADAYRLLIRDFPASTFLDAEGCGRLREDLARLGLSGGSVYDALIAAAARQAGHRLGSMDRRAKPTYEAFGIDVLIVE
jgi:predicted nucleic acid-binding protein